LLLPHDAAMAVRAMRAASLLMRFTDMGLIGVAPVNTLRPQRFGCCSQQHVYTTAHRSAAFCA
jgi:hypothetical protein